jgi:hypothetical protein
MSRLPDLTPTGDVDPPPPWWHEPTMWLIVGGPAVVVVASFVTLTLAIRHPDPVYSTVDATGHAERPAIEARNHAATPR